MAKINNADIIKNITDELRIDTVIEPAPTDLGKTVVPVFVANRSQKVQEFYDYENETQIVRHDILLSSSSASVTLFTTANLDTEDFFLVGCSLSRGQNSSATNIQTAINVTIDGVAQVVLGIHSLAGLNEAAATLAQTFPRPLRIDKNTAITLTFTGVSSTARAGAEIYGFVRPKVAANK